MATARMDRVLTRTIPLLPEPNAKDVPVPLQVAAAIIPP